jgi:hypothetical protein
LKQPIVHLPELALSASKFRHHGGSFGVRMHFTQGETPKHKPETFSELLLNLLDVGVGASATPFYFPMQKVDSTEIANIHAGYENCISSGDLLETYFCGRSSLAMTEAPIPVTRHGTPSNLLSALVAIIGMEQRYLRWKYQNRLTHTPVPESQTRTSS